MQKLRAIVLIVFVAVILLAIPREDFSTRREKASAIVDWFTKNPKPTYVQYRKDLGQRSNIVEYEDALRLVHNRNLTVASMIDNV